MIMRAQVFHRSMASSFPCGAECMADLVITHRIPQSVICGDAGPTTALANASCSQTLPDHASVVGLLVLTLDFRENFLRSFGRARCRGIDRCVPGAGKSEPADGRAR